MPTGTRVDKMYHALLREGKTPADAAKIAQSKTGLALKTGQPPKHPSGMYDGPKRSYRKRKA